MVAIDNDVQNEELLYEEKCDIWVHLDIFEWIQRDEDLPLLQVIWQTLRDDVHLISDEERKIRWKKYEPVEYLNLEISRHNRTRSADVNRWSQHKLLPISEE